MVVLHNFHYDGISKSGQNLSERSHFIVSGFDNSPFVFAENHN